MFNIITIKSMTKLFTSLLLVYVILFLASPAGAVHWASSVVPPHGEEALTWCGPATGQMIMEGYPGSACTFGQDDIWMAIQTYKTESMWDTDPAGLRGAIRTLCPPPGGAWSIYHNTDPQVVMHSAARWMTHNSYPVAVLLNTLSHNTFVPHQERWAAIQSIQTDLDPTTNSTVNLLQVVIVDPAVPFTTTPTPLWISGSEWYSSEFQAVTKAGSMYTGEYIAIIEPPEIIGRAVAPKEILTGRLIPPEKIIKKALQGLKAEGIYTIKAFRALNKLKPATPLLINKNFGGYYLIPFTLDGEQGPTSIAVLANAYTGTLKQVKIFDKPVQFLPKAKAMEIALKYLKEKPDKAMASLIYQPRQSENKFSPVWQITANEKTVGVDGTGKIITRNHY